MAAPPAAMTGCTKRPSITPTFRRSWEFRTDGGVALRRLPCDKRRRRSKGAERIHIRRASNAALCENGGDVTRRRHVKRRMRGMNIRSDANALQMRDFSRGALFNRNVLAIRNG